MGSFSVQACVLMILVVLSSSNAGRVLVYPVDGSHWLNMRLLVEALRARGHQVTVVRSSTSWYVTETSPHYTSITIPLQEPQVIESKTFMANFLMRSLELRRGEGTPWAFLAIYDHLFSMIRQKHDTLVQMAAAMFENQTLLRELKEAEFDLVLTDPVFSVGVLLARYLQLPLCVECPLDAQWRRSLFHSSLSSLLHPPTVLPQHRQNGLCPEAV